MIALLSESELLSVKCDLEGILTTDAGKRLYRNRLRLALTPLDNLQF